MTRAEIEHKILQIFREAFEISNPGLEDNLREIHNFDSIDAIELLGEIEAFLEVELTQEEKKQAMEIRTMQDIFHYVEQLAQDKGKIKNDEMRP